MPKLVVFAACERATIDRQSGIASLFGLIQDLKVQIPEEQEPTRAAMGGLRWDAFSLWLRTDDDEGKTYEQRVVLFDPSGEPTELSGVAPISAEKGVVHRVITTVYGFPVGAMGRYVLKLWIYEQGQEAGDAIAEYPIFVVRESPKSEGPKSPTSPEPPPGSPAPSAGWP